jgi:hypothetical protein
MKKIEHAKAVVWLFSTWCIAVAWLWPHAVRAGTLSADLRVYDWSSLGYAAALGLLGGLLALIVALATDHRVLMEVLKESLRNALVSPIAGTAAYLLLEAMGSLGWLMLPAVGRFLVIMGSGWAGIAFFIWARDVASKGATAFGQWLVARGAK